jgi:signal transduction histidine kinase
MSSFLLTIHNIGFIINAVLLFFLIIIVYVKGPDKKQNQLLALGFLSIFIWVVSHVIGVNITDPYISKLVLMPHVSILFISTFLAHFIFVFLDKEKEQRLLILSFYTYSIYMTVVYLAFPDSLITNSIPKLYFPNYYVAGNLHWIMSIVSNILIPTYFLGYMANEYRKQNDIMKNRIKYLLSGLIFGYSLGGIGIPLVFTSNPVVFGFTIDPVYSVLFIPLFSIPFAYAVLKYELVNIKIIAKQAFVYALLVTIVGSAVAILQYMDDTIRTTYPALPAWIFPLGSSLTAVTIGFFVWKKLREVDILKDEFITVMTHKFRTPLTQIRWATESFSTQTKENDSIRVDAIQKANIKLIELTDLLVQVSDADTINFNYNMRPNGIKGVIENMKIEYLHRAQIKDIVLFFDITLDAVIFMDIGRIQFVIQTLLDNAIAYTPTGGAVKVELKEELDKNGIAKNVLLIVNDSGIGFTPEELDRLFKKFWRSAGAFKIDTEGMGIGLFLAKRIVEHHKGSLSAQSEGLGKGTSFIMRLPIYEEKNK